MSQTQETQTPQPTPTPRTAATIRADIRAAQASLDEYTLLRTDAAARFDATTRPGEKARLNGDLRRLDGQIEQLREQLAGLNAQLRQVEVGSGPGGGARTKIAQRTTTPVAPASPLLPGGSPGSARTFSSGITVPPNSGIDDNALALGGALTVFVLAPLAFALAWRLIRGTRSQASPAELAENRERLHRIEQAVDTIAVEVERISENQRYLTNTIASESKVR